MKKKLLIVILAILLATCAIALHCSRYYSEACDTYAENRIKGDVANKINAKTAEYLYQNGVKYSDIAKINYSSTGSIVSITIDSVYLNIIATELSQIIYDSIEIGENEYGIPLGNISGSKFFSGRGPKINVRISHVGSVVHSIESELISGGINQTLHRINIVFDVVISCIAPFNETKSTIRTQIAVAESIIVGEVPDVLVSPAR